MHLAFPYRGFHQHSRFSMLVLVEDNVLAADILAFCFELRQSDTR